MAAGLLLAPLIRRTRNVIDKTFFPEFFERKEKLARLGQQILLCKNSSEFNQVILDSIFTSFKITKSYLFIWNDERKNYLLQSETVWGSLIEKDKTTELAPEHAVPKYLRSNPYLLHDDVRRDFSPNLDQRALSLAMLEMGAAPATWAATPVCGG